MGRKAHFRKLVRSLQHAIFILTLVVEECVGEATRPIVQFVASRGRL